MPVATYCKTDDQSLIDEQETIDEQMKIHPVKTIQNNVLSINYI